MTREKCPYCVENANLEKTNLEKINLGWFQVLFFRLRSCELTKITMLFTAGAFLLSSSICFAQASGPPSQNPPASDVKKEEETEKPKVRVERGRGGRKVYVIKTGFVIEGRIQKPNAFYVLQRSQINYDWAALKQEFVPRILDSVKKSPF